MFRVGVSQNKPEDEAETAAKLAGVTSRETQLSVLSIVDDPSAEMEKIENEQDYSGFNTDGFALERTAEGGEE